MNAAWKAVVVVALVVAVIAVVASKHRARQDAASTANERNEATSWNSLTGQDDAPGQNEPLPRLVDVGAGTCIPCKKMMPVLAELKTEYTGSLQVEYYNVNDDPNVITEYDVTIIPTQIFYDASGQERFRHTGFLGKKDILAKWNELGVELTRAK
jgi:thioredoxin 1